MRLYFLLLVSLFSIGFVSAQNIEIIPEANKDTVIQEVTSVASGGHVWDAYNTIVEKDNRPLADQLSS